MAASQEANEGTLDIFNKINIIDASGTTAPAVPAGFTRIFFDTDTESLSYSNTIVGGPVIPGSSDYKRTIVNAATYTILSSDDIISVTYTVTGTCTLTLPNITQKKIYTIIDEGGNAATNNITINADGSDTIVGTSSLVINGNYGSVVIYNDDISSWYLKPSQPSFESETLTLSTLIMKPNVPVSITHATDSAADDFTISQTGATDSSLILTSEGTGTDAIDVNATAGGITVDASGALSLDAGAASNLTTSSGAITVDGAAGVDIQYNGVSQANFGSDGTVALKSNNPYTIEHSTNAGSQDLLIYQKGSNASRLKLQAEGTSTSAIELQSDNGGIYLQAFGTTTNAIHLDSSGGIWVNADERMWTRSNYNGPAAIDIREESGGVSSSVKFKCDSGTGAKAVDIVAKVGTVHIEGGVGITLQAASGQSMGWPTSRGTDGQFLQTDGSGGLSFEPTAHAYTLSTIKTTNYTVAVDGTDEFVQVDTSGGAVTITLPEISTITVTGNKLRIIVIDVDGSASTNNITVSRSSTDTILGQTSYTMNLDYSSVSFVSNGSDKWLVY